MLVTTAEIWPVGDCLRSHEIGEIKISNESGLAHASNYSVAGSQWGALISGAPAFDSGLSVLNHRRADGAWALVRATLDQTLRGLKTEERATAGGRFDA